MAKPLQQDNEGNIINDVETKKTQKAYDKYEADNAKKQADRETKDKETMKKLKGFIGLKKGGTASARADGIAIRGKTRA
jgi:hypothetical protein